jgi:hypothetical protein
VSPLNPQRRRASHNFDKHSAHPFFVSFPNTITRTHNFSLYNLTVTFKSKPYLNLRYGSVSSVRDWDNWEQNSHTDVELNVFVSDIHFRIDLFTANFEGNLRLLKEYLLHVKHSDPEYIPPLPENLNDYEELDPLEEFYEWAMEPFLPLFREILPLNCKRTYTLQDCPFPRQVRYTLRLAGDELVPVPLDATVDCAPVGVLLPAAKKLDGSIFPVYRPSDIHIRLSDDAVALPT